MIIIKTQPKLSKQKEKHLAKMIQQVIDDSIYEHSNFNWWYDNKMTYKDPDEKDEETNKPIKRIPGIIVEYKNQ